MVEGRKFRTEADYQNALKDQQVIENLRVQTKKMSLADQKKLLEVIRSGRCRFHSILGQDYMEELSEDIQRQEGKVPETSPAKGHFLQKENTKTIGKAQTPKNKKEASKKKETVKKESPDKKVPKKSPTTKKKTSVKKKAEPQFDEAEIDKIVQEELKKQEKRRKLLVVCCSVIAVVCLGYFGIYNWYNIRTADNYEQLSELKDKEPATGQNQDPVIHYTADETQSTPPPVLDEYEKIRKKTDDSSIRKIVELFLKEHEELDISEKAFCDLLVKYLYDVFNSNAETIQALMNGEHLGMKAANCDYSTDEKKIRLIQQSSTRWEVQV